MPLPLAALAIGGGSALSAIGSLVGGASANRAGRQARDFSDSRTGAQQLAVGSSFFGPEYADLVQTSQLLQIARQRQDIPEMERLTRLLNEGITRMGGPIQEQQRGLARSVSDRQTGNLAYFDAETAGLNADEDAAMGEFDKGTADQLALADAWGQGRARVINEDFDTDLRAMDDSALATLAATGFGNSTARGNSLRENRTVNRRERTRALQDLSEASVDRRLGVAANRGNLRAGLRADRTGRRYSRAASRMGLEERNLGRDIALHGEPINSALAMHQSSVLNPWLGANTSQYYPGSSGLATALSEVGGAAAGLGAWGVGEQSALARIRAAQGRGPVP